MNSEAPIALVTGATSGIGRAVAIELGATHHVLVGGRDRGRVDELVAALPSADPFVADLVSGPIPALPASLDVLVHSAGVEDGSTIELTDVATWRAVFDANVFAVADLSRLALPALRAASGLVVTINSGSGFTAAPGGGVYAASKFALRAFTDALREEERGNGVRVSSVHPGRTDTAMQRRKVAAEGDEYEPRLYLAPESVALAVRTVVDMPPGGTIETLTLRPTARH